VPNQPKTPNRVVRVETSLWRAAQEKAAAEGRSLSSVIVAYLRRYVATPVRKRDDA
jgi:predicted HicB family RNase H-like nuclease